MLAPRVGRSPTFHRRNAVCRHESPNRQPRQGNRSKKAPRKVHASLPSPPEPIHVIASFRPYVLHGMRVARYAPRKQKPAERIRCIYSSGSPHYSLFRPVQPIPLRLAPSPFRIDSTHFFLLFLLPPTAALSLSLSYSLSSFCHRDSSISSLLYPFAATRSQLLFPLLSLLFLCSLETFLLPTFLSLFSFSFASLPVPPFPSSLEQTCFPPSFAARRESAASKIDNRANDGQASNFH